MSVSGVGITETSLLQSALQISRSTTEPEASDTFGSLLSGAMTGAQGSEASYGQTYDLYAALLEQSSGTTAGALMSAMMNMGDNSTSTMMFLSLFEALAGRTVQPTDGAAAYMTAGAGTGEVTMSPWKPTDPAVTSNVTNRSAGRYTAVINQFGVETNPRYSTSRGGTYCNIFVWDVTSAMGVEIPHYYNAETGEPMEYRETGATQMTANGIYNWLHQYGGQYGWAKVSAEEAQRLANQGHPVVTALYRGGRHGHVQMVCPSRDGEYNKEKGVTIAQAGRNLRSYTYITDIYNASLPKVTYFVHA